MVGTFAFCSVIWTTEPITEIRISNLPININRCGACQAMAPEFEDFAKEVADSGVNVRVGEVDIDENPIVLNSWTILKLPTLMHVLPNREGWLSLFSRTF